MVQGNGEVFNLEVGLGRSILEVAVVVAVSFDTTWVFFPGLVVRAPDTVGIGQRTDVALGEVKHIVVVVHGEEVFDVHCTAEELDTVVCRLVDEDVFDRRTGAYTVQGEPVVLYFVILVGAGVLEDEVLDGA